MIIYNRDFVNRSLFLFSYFHFVSHAMRSYAGHGSPFQRHHSDRCDDNTNLVRARLDCRRWAFNSLPSTSLPRSVVFCCLSPGSSCCCYCIFTRHPHCSLRLLWDRFSCIMALHQSDVSIDGPKYQQPGLSAFTTMTTTESIHFKFSKA